MGDGEKMQKKGQSFIKGALVLGVANLVVKIIGAVFKIPLINLIGDDGSGYFNVAYQIYTFMFIVATAGFPIAISKMVAESIARDNERDARRIFQTAISFLTVIGLVGSLILYFFADQLANLVGIADAALGIRAISPAVFFVSMVSAFRGYFQGRQNMFPTAFSEIIEAGAKLLGLALAALFMHMAVSPALSVAVDWAKRLVDSAHTQTVFASAGAIFGVTIGTFLSFLLLSVIYFFSKRHYRLAHRTETVRPRSVILKELILIAIPITIGASVSSLTTLIDMATISKRLITNPVVFDEYAFMFSEGTKFFEKALEEGWTGAALLEQKAATLYGMYTGKALTMFNLPLTLIVALGMSVVPAISAAVAKHQRGEAKTITESTIRIAMLFAAPCALGMASLSKQVLQLLFNDYNAHVVLSILSVAIIPVALVSVTNAILQAYGKVYVPVVNMLIGGAAKVLFNFFCIPILGIDGAPLGTTLCYLIIAVLNMVSIVRVSGMRFHVVDFLAKPLIAAGAMGVLGLVLDHFLPLSRWIAIPEIAVCGVFYGIAVFAVRAIKREDVLRLPKGEKIAAILTRCKLLK